MVGSIAVGQHVLELGAGEGARVRAAPAGEAASTGLASERVMRVPALGPALVGREADVKRILSALDTGEVVEVNGPPGVGKTALLRHLGHRAEAVPAAGALYCRGAQLSVDDLLTWLFAALHRSERPSVPTPAEVRRGLTEAAVLVLVDDLEAGAESATRLVTALPRCRVVVASTRRQLPHGGRTIELSGLCEAAALALLQGELGRLLRTEEHEPARVLCRRLGSRPLGILQAASAVRSGEVSLAELAEDPVLSAGVGAEWLSVLGALAALDGAPIRTEHLGPIAGVPDDRVVERLGQRHLVQPDPAGWTLAAPLAQDLRDRDRWAARALSHLAGWAPGADESAVADQADALLAVLRWGAAHQRWLQVLELARALDVPLAAGGRWDAWKEAAEAAVSAAKALRDVEAEAWALNQLRARAVCRGEDEEAQRHAERAVPEREGHSDRAPVAGANLVGVPGPAPEGADRVAQPRSRRWRVVLPVAGAIVGTIAGVLLARGDLGASDEAPPAPASAVDPPASDPRPTGGADGSGPPAATPATPARPDLVVTAARAVPEGASGCTVRWTVTNRGERTAQGTRTTLLYRLASGGSGRTGVSLPSLGPGVARGQFKASGNYRCSEFASLTVRADANGSVSEADEDNNEARATSPS